MNDEMKSLYCWFDVNRNEIIKDHENENVLIFNHSVCGYFKDEDSALLKAKNDGLELGQFLVQPCISESEELKMTFNAGACFG